MVSAACLLGSCCVVRYAVCWMITFVVGLCSLCCRCGFGSLGVFVYFYFDVVWVSVWTCVDFAGLLAFVWFTV